MSQISQAQPEDFPLILTLLERCRLPQEGLSVSFSHILIVREADQVMGCAALEVYGNVALLRSVAIDPTCRSLGMGHQLVQMQLEEARRIGIREVYPAFRNGS